LKSFYAANSLIPNLIGEIAKKTLARSHVMGTLERMKDRAPDLHLDGAQECVPFLSRDKVHFAFPQSKKKCFINQFEFKINKEFCPQPKQKNRKSEYSRLATRQRKVIITSKGPK